jgi:hypothetical protein
MIQQAKNQQQKITGNPQQYPLMRYNARWIIFVDGLVLDLLRNSKQLAWPFDAVQINVKPMRFRMSSGLDLGQFLLKERSAFA